MKKTLEQQIEAAKKNAARDGIRVVADLGSVFYTTSSQGERHLYRVAYDGETMTCPCKATCYCKHMAACQAELDKQQAEREAVAAEVIAEMQTQEAAQVATYDVVAEAEQVAAAETRINTAAKQRMVERIRERDAIMGRHTELGPTLKPFDYVEADKRETALLAQMTDDKPFSIWK